jgi:glycosyltransferase involved in cell wall biosynthesis
VLRTLIADTEAMDAMRSRARRHVEADYQWHDKIDRYEELYSNLAGLGLSESARRSN